MAINFSFLAVESREYFVVQSAPPEKRLTQVIGLGNAANFEVPKPGFRHFTTGELASAALVSSA